MTPFKYGDMVRDELTGYIGFITARCDYFGKEPMKYLVESTDSTGRPCEAWLSYERLVLIDDFENMEV